MIRNLFWNLILDLRIEGLQEKKEYAEDYEKYCSKSVMHKN
jgi:hypothetical protein